MISSSQLISTSLVIDKTRIGYNFSKSPHGKADYEAMHHFITQTCFDQSFAASSKWTSKKHAWTCGRVQLDEGIHLTLGIGYTPHGQRAFFQFNPSKLTDKAWCAFQAALMTMLFQEWNGMIANGNVLTMEFACDVTNASYNDFIFIDTKVRSINTTNDENGTLYLGSMSSSRQIACYDKGKELHDARNIDLDHPLLRVEARLHPSKALYLNELDQVQNPFAPVLIVPRQALLDATALSGSAGRFRKHVSNGYAPNHAYELCAPLDKQNRNAYVEALRQLVPSWWNPAQIWKTAPAALAWTSH